jgi:hypothetical protein
VTHNHFPFHQKQTNKKKKKSLHKPLLVQQRKKKCRPKSSLINRSARSSKRRKTQKKKKIVESDEEEQEEGEEEGEEINVCGTLNLDQLTALDTLLAFLRQETLQNQLITFQEGTLKTFCVQAFLKAGYQIVEGSKNKFQVLEMNSEGIIVPVDGKKFPPHGSGSRDIKVLDPHLHIELKCISEFGTKAGALTKPLNEDIDVLNSGNAHVFILVCSSQAYGSLRKNKSFNLKLPDSTTVKGFFTTFECGEHTIRVCRVPSKPIARFIVAVFKLDKNFP